MPPLVRLIAKLFARPPARPDRRRPAQLGLEWLEGRDVPTGLITVEALGSAAEGGTGAPLFRFTRDGDLSTWVMASITFGGTAVRGTGADADYDALAYVFFPNGAAVCDVQLAVADDATFEGPETVTATIGVGMNGNNQAYGPGTPGTAEFTIADNDPAPVVSVERVADAVEGGADGTFQFTRTGPTTSDLTIAYTVQTGGPADATSGADYSTLSGVVTIPAGLSYQYLSVHALSDNTFDPDEEVTISIDPNPRFDRAPGLGRLGIADASFVVTTTADTIDATDNLTSLREALIVVNDAPRVNHRVISFNFPGTTGTITLGSTLPAVETAVYIAGPGDRGVTITGGVRHLEVSPNADLMVAGVRFLNGSVAGDGGSIHAEGNLTVTNCEFIGNFATNGGAIAANYDENSDIPIVTISNSLFTGNTAELSGGAIYVNGVNLTISDSYIVLNTAGMDGGGIAIETDPPVIDPTDPNPPFPGDYRSPAMLTNVQISGNSAARHGGGIYAQVATLLLTGGTNVEENTASDSGGGLYAFNSAVLIGEGGARFASNHATTGLGIFLTDDSYLNMLPTLAGGDNVVGGIW